MTVVMVVVVMTVMTVMAVVHDVPHAAATHHVPATAAATTAAVTAAMAAGVSGRGGESRHADSDRCGESEDCSALEHVSGSFGS
jgi:hypothetical protein